MKVIVTEKLTPDAISYLKERGMDVDVKLALSQEELCNIINQYDAIIVRSATKINSIVLENANNLKVVGRAGNGTDNIDVSLCTKKGIIVVNTPEGNIMAAAELAIGLCFCVFRNIPQSHLSIKNNDFRRSNFSGNELAGKTAGIIGLGRISSIVAARLKACNMHIIAYDPYVTDEMFDKHEIEKCNALEELLSRADLITVHTPKTNETYGMIGEKELNLCKRGVRIVNAARGGIINENALYNALKSGQVLAAAIDVLDPEPNYTLPPEQQTYTNALLELDNCIITPHLGASTQEASYNVSMTVAELVADSLEGKMVAAVNLPNTKVKNLSLLKPYMELAEKLGKIYYQVEKETVIKVEIIFSGDLVEKETDILTLSALKGFLQPITIDKVNYVNANMILKNMGISVVESKTYELEKYTNLITVKFITKSKTFKVAGTVFAKEEIRIVDYFGYNLDFDPTLYVLAVKNVDKPGIIGKIGTVLGENNINIASMQLARNTKGDVAASFISVDAEVPSKVINLLKEIDGIVKISSLKF